MNTKQREVNFSFLDFLCLGARRGKGLFYGI